MKKVLIGVVAVIFVLGLWLGGIYNGLVKKDQEVSAQWAQVETQYQRRFDLIPNLVNATKAVLNQEQEVFGQIAEARTRYSGATSDNEKVAAASEVESALGRLLVIVENYPQLKSDVTVQNFMDELSGTENRVAVERKRYNDLVAQYNVMVKTLPTSLVAGMFGFSQKAFFEAASGAELAPQVNFE